MASRGKRHRPRTVLIDDEIDSLSFGGEQAKLLFNVVANDERGAIVPTRKLPFAQCATLQQQAFRLIEQAGARQHPRTRKAHQRERAYQRRISGNVSGQEVQFVPGPRIVFR